MTISLPMLERVRVASPCDARWEEMVGDDTIRRCGQCDLNVHNLSAMTRDEATALLEKHFHADGTPREGRFCARLFRRVDGTVLTQDCPVGLARVRARAKAALIRVAAAVGLAAVVGWIASRAGAAGNSLSRYEPVASLVRTLQYAGIKRTPPMMGKMIMGDVVCPPVVNRSIQGR